MRTALLLAFLVAPACTANDDIHAPFVGSVVPDRAVPGAQIQIDGAYFCAQPDPEPGDVDPLACENIGTVVFGTVAGVASSYTDTMILAEVPALPTGPVDVWVSVAGRASNDVVLVVE